MPRQVLESLGRPRGFDLTRVSRSQITLPPSARKIRHTFVCTSTVHYTVCTDPSVILIEFQLPGSHIVHGALNDKPHFSNLIGLVFNCNPPSMGATALSCRQARLRIVLPGSATRNSVPEYTHSFRLLYCNTEPRPF